MTIEGFLTGFGSVANRKIDQGRFRQNKKNSGEQQDNIVEMINLGAEGGSGRRN
jgi:hypothetical protein